MQRWPFGRWLFGRIVCWKAPYFSTIAPRFTRVEPGRCEVEIADRRAVHNHIGTVHAIALCNLAELAAGVMMEATTPASMRWIPKGMTVEYLGKAIGNMRAIARPIGLVEHRESGYELPVVVDVRDAGEAAVFRARITMWLSPRPRKHAHGDNGSVTSGDGRVVIPGPLDSFPTRRSDEYHPPHERPTRFPRRPVAGVLLRLRSGSAACRCAAS